MFTSSFQEHSTVFPNTSVLSVSTVGIGAHSKTNPKSIPHYDFDMAMQVLTMNHFLSEPHKSSILKNTADPLLGVDLSLITVARYHLDFGSVIVGSTRKKTVQLKCVSFTSDILWELTNVKQLQSGGDFSIEPVKSKLEKDTMSHIVVKCSPALDKKLGIIYF